MPWNATDGTLGVVVLATRRLRRAPLFTLAATMLLGVGVGLGVPLFQYINVLLLKPAAASRDYAWVAVNGSAGSTLRPAEVDDLLARPPAVFDGLVGAGTLNTTAVVDGVSLRVNIEGVAGPYFREFPATPLLGRVLTSDDERNVADVAVISERLWRVAFGGRRDAVGREAVFGGRTLVVVGVVPESFIGAPVPRSFVRRDAWVPPHVVAPGTVFGLLGAGVTLDEASAELSSRSQPRGVNENPRELGVRQGMGVRLGERGFVIVTTLLIVGVAISLVAAGSFSLLLFARLLSGQADLSIRLALGATARDLTRLLVCEAGLLALGATVIALLVGNGLMAWVFSQLSAASGLAFAPELKWDWRLVAYTAATTFGAAAMVVARLSWNLRSLEALGSMVATSGVGGSTQRTASETNRLVIAQTAVSTALLLVAALLGRTVTAGVDAAPTMDTDRSAVTWLDHRALPDDSADASATIGRAADVTSEVPGVTASAVVTRLPGGPTRSTGVSLGSSADRRWLTAQYARGDVFGVLGPRLLRGRPFTPDEENAGAPVAIVGVSTATSFWPGDDAVGKRLWFTGRDGVARPFVVIGVAEDLPRHAGDRREPRDDYLPLAHRPAYEPVGIVARASEDGIRLAERLREAYRERLPDTGLLHVRSMREELDDRLAAASFSARIYSLLGVLVFIVAMGGLYGLSAQLAALRRREIGIRRALGATTVMLCRMLHGEHSRMLALGVGSGCLAGLFVASLLLRYFPTLRLWDPAAVVAVAGALYAAGLSGALAPFVRAMGSATMTLRD